MGFRRLDANTTCGPVLIVLRAEHLNGIQSRDEDGTGAVWLRHLAAESLLGGS